MDIGRRARAPTEERLQRYIPKVDLLARRAHQRMAAVAREAERRDNVASVEQSGRAAIQQLVVLEENMTEMSRVLAATRAVA